MFDCINGILSTPILEYFITNATIRAYHTRQRNIPHVTQTFGTISERSVTHKEPKTWREIPQTIRLHQNKNIFTRLLKQRLHHQVLLNVQRLHHHHQVLLNVLLRYNYHCPNWVSVLCMGVWWWWCRCVSPRRGWVCLGETLVVVCLLPVLMSCVWSCSGWVRPALSLWCSLVVLSRVSECARMGGGPRRSLACLLWTSLCFIAYNIGTIRSAK